MPTWIRPNPLSRKVERRVQRRSVHRSARELMRTDPREPDRRLLALAERTDQAAFREISAFVLAADEKGDVAQIEFAQKVLVHSAKTFTQLLSMTFQAVAWNKEVLYDEETFQANYERVSKATARFTMVDETHLAQLLVDYPPSLLVLRCIAALSLDEISLLLKETGGIKLTKDQMREFELGRDIGRADAARWFEASKFLAKTITESISGSLLDLPNSVDKRLFKGRKDKADTREGWKSATALAESGVPYWRLLYQRYVGGFFRQAMDASSSVKGDILELAIARLLEAHGVSFYRTKAREKLPGWEQAPDFLLPSREQPTVAIEAKLAEDGGTARDKAARIERFCIEAREKGVFPVVVIDGKGFYRINDVTAPIVRNTRGETYTLKTLERILAIPQLAKAGRGSS